MATKRRHAPKSGTKKRSRKGKVSAYARALGRVRKMHPTWSMKKVHAYLRSHGYGKKKAKRGGRKTGKRKAKKTARKHPKTRRHPKRGAKKGARKAKRGAKKGRRKVGKKRARR